MLTHNQSSKLNHWSIILIDHFPFVINLFYYKAWTCHTCSYMQSAIQPKSELNKWQRQQSFQWADIQEYFFFKKVKGEIENKDHYHIFPF